MGDFTLEIVLNFMIANGGQVQNHKLVTHFKDVLNHSTNKVTNREKFKDYINELATIKVIEGEKTLVLRKKYCQAAATVQTSAATLQDSQHTHSEGQSVAAADVGSQMDIDSPDGGMVSKARIDETMEVKIVDSDRIPLSVGKVKDNAGTSIVTDSTSSLASAESHKSLASSTSGVSSMEDDSSAPVFSVKDKIKKLNKNISDSDLIHTKSGGSGTGNKKVYKHAGLDDDASHSYESPVILDADQKDWLVVCSSSDYHDINKILTRKPTLAKLKDLTNTALHWAAKSGRSEVIKLLASKSAVSVNQRSHESEIATTAGGHQFIGKGTHQEGHLIVLALASVRSGYTALHLAAINGHENIMELLILTYKADTNLRDYSGKKAKQYLKNSTSKIHQLLVSRKLGSEQGIIKSGSDPFMRSASRKSNKGKGVSSLLLAMSSVAKQPLLNWSISPDEVFDEKDGHLKTSPGGSAGSSPGSSRTNSSQDISLMSTSSELSGTSQRKSTSITTTSSQEASPSLRNIKDENLDLMRSESDLVLIKLPTDGSI